MTTRARLARLDRVTRGLIASGRVVTLAVRKERARRVRELIARMERLYLGVPEAYRDRIEQVIVEQVAPGMVGDAGYIREDAPAVARWVWNQVSLGDDHPLNRPIADPTPAALLEVLFARPDAELVVARCRECRAVVPHEPSVLDDRGYHRVGRPLIDACCYCGTPTSKP